MPIDHFSEDYSTVKDALSGKTFAAPIDKAMLQLIDGLQADGPESGLGPKLDILRQTLRSGNEAENVLKGVGLTPVANTVPTAEAVKKVACVKFLRHMYLEGSTGAQTVWVHSSPKIWRKYTWDVIHDARTSCAALSEKLKDVEEFFNAAERARLAEATRLGASWVQKSLLVLAQVGGDAAAKKILDRWFAPSPADTATTVSLLQAGFKKIQSTLNDTKVVLTDNPKDRESTGDLQYTEAYVYDAPFRPKAIYIEQALAKNFDVSVLHDVKKNWARVIVHECSHLDVNTEDERYAYKGITPGDKITSKQALNNADSWAFFAADCGGALVDNDRTRALNGTGSKGLPKELPMNWN